ncbi:EXOS5 protein, partial [Urocynchramus pylzowi]|nr:EXOS5 protein [Urocynchramus pylzowi]
SVCPGDTSVLAGLYGPAEAKVSKELPDRAALEVLLRPKVGLPGSFPPSADICFPYSSSFQSCWVANPAQPGPCWLALPQLPGDQRCPCCWHRALAAVTARCHAAVPVPVPGLRGSLCLPRCRLEPPAAAVPAPGEARAVLTFAIASGDGKLLMATTKGSCSVEEMQQCLAAAQRAAGTIFQFYRDSVRRRYSK